MTSEVLGEMFEGDSADMCAGKFPHTSMGGRAEGLAYADPGARIPIGLMIPQSSTMNLSTEGTSPPSTSCTHLTMSILNQCPATIFLLPHPAHQDAVPHPHIYEGFAVASESRFHRSNKLPLCLQVYHSHKHLSTNWIILILLHLFTNVPLSLHQELNLSTTTSPSYI